MRCVAALGSCLLVLVLSVSASARWGEGDGLPAFVDLGCGLAGITGAPVLIGGGDLTAGSGNAVGVVAAAQSAPAVLFVSLVPGSVAFKGGTLKAFPLLAPPLAQVTDPNGELFVLFTMPAGLGGLGLVLQYAVLDAAAVQGVALSNALQLNFP